MTYTENYICKKVADIFEIDPCNSDFPELYREVKESLCSMIDDDISRANGHEGDDWLSWSFDCAEKSAELTLLINAEKVLFDIHRRWMEGEIEA